MSRYRRCPRGGPLRLLSVASANGAHGWTDDDGGHTPVRDSASWHVAQQSGQKAPKQLGPSAFLPYSKGQTPILAHTRRTTVSLINLRSNDHRTVSLDVCVIGAGASGLVAMKELLDEGHVVSCYEKADRQGGLFNYSPTHGGVYDSTRLTISNNFMAFSS